MKKFLLKLTFLYSITFQPTFASDLELNTQFLKLLRHSFNCEATSALANLSAPTLLKVLANELESSIKNFDLRTQKKINSIVNLSNLPPTPAEYRELQFIHFEALKCRRQLIDIAPAFGREMQQIISVQEWVWNNAEKENKPIRAYYEVFLVPAAGEIKLFGEKLNLVGIDKNPIGKELKIEGDNFSKKIEAINRKLIDKIDLYLRD